ncbi:MAG: glycosyltransferase family 4 protein [Phycisphaerae bacterium]
MKICHVITRLIVGGAQENTLLTCRGLVERGHDVTLVSGPETGPEGSLWAQARQTGCDVRVVSPLCRAVNPSLDLRALYELRRIIDGIRPDVVHTHSSKAGIIGRAAAAGVDVPAVVHTIHGMSFNRTQPAGTRTLYRWLEQWAAQHTTAFIAVAHAMIDQAVEAGIARRESFTMIRSGLDTDRFKPTPALRDQVRSEWGVKDCDVVVGTIARLVKNKGYEEIMAAMPNAVECQPNLRFVWVGDGVNRHEYERRLRDLGLRHHVRFLGLVNPDEVPRLANGFDIAVHASQWEGLPRSLVQAMLMEVPVISFDNDGAPEIVVPGETGVLVPFGDIRAFEEAMVVLARDSKVRRVLGRQGRSRCLRDFDWRTMVEQIEVLYQAQITAEHEPTWLAR